MWGKFDAPKMVVHCADAIRMALGQLPTKSKNTPLRRAPLKQLFVYWMPWPEGRAHGPELLQRTPADWDAEVGVLLELMEEAGSAPRGYEWASIPRSAGCRIALWGVLGYRHLDHHFRQFGIAFSR